MTYKLVTILPYPSHNPPSQLACPPGNYSFTPGGDALKEPLAQLLVTVVLPPHPSEDGWTLPSDNGPDDLHRPDISHLRCLLLMWDP